MFVSFSLTMSTTAHIFPTLLLGGQLGHLSFCQQGNTSSHLWQG